MNPLRWLARDLGVEYDPRSALEALAGGAVIFAGFLAGCVLLYGLIP